MGPHASADMLYVKESTRNRRLSRPDPPCTGGGANHACEPSSNASALKTPKRPHRTSNAAVDNDGHRTEIYRLTSIEYIDGTGRKRGGGRHALVGMCEASSNLWFLPVSKKSEVEQAVQNMIAHIEIEMRKSCDHDGGTPKVKRVSSDRDANITSTKAVTHFLEERIEQVLTATHAKNQTPRLDAKIRRSL